jgi:hypothetical protein
MALKKMERRGTVNPKETKKHLRESNLPLPFGERIQVRGKLDKTISTLTPTLSRQREKG